jgi:anti-anti-sigma factor
MKFREDKIDAVLVLRLEEARLDGTISSEMKTELLRLVETENEKNILLDLASVEYADSSGLGSLLFGHRQAANHDGAMKLLHLNQKVLTLMKIAKLERLLEWYQDEDTALNSFGKTGAEY